MSKRASDGDTRPAGGRLLARNSYISFVGQVLPIPVAIFAIPLLLNALGTERFGLLALAWVVMSYFALFDFGMGRAITKFVAEYRARKELDDLPELIWTSAILLTGLGVLAGGVLAITTPWLTENILNISAALVSEAKISFYLLAVSVPLILANAALRGVLEAIQRFDLLTAVKVPASLINYLGPLPVLLIVDNLAAVVGLLVISRGAVLLAHLFLCLRTMPSLWHGFRFNANLVKPLISLGGWLTVFGAVGPSVASIDRFMIGALISLSAVTLYTTPYEVVTKLTIFSAGMLTVLFPAFSAMSVDRAQEIRRLYSRALRYLLVLVAPIVGLVLALASELLNLWVGPDFTESSAVVAQWLAIGMLIHTLAHVSFTVLQGVGRADVTAKLQLIQLPFYLLAVWVLIGFMGIIGVAIAWALRVTVDALILFFLADRLLPRSELAVEKTASWPQIAMFVSFLAFFFGCSLLSSNLVFFKFVLVFLLLGLFVLWEWRLFLNTEDRKTFVGGAKSLLSTFK